ncbi:MAG: phage major capsid protein [Hyphomicrobiaceae bacterium]|nr:MAG: phage major capsid protein [Hyphomicrobiaceae bacterium]
MSMHERIELPPEMSAELKRLTAEAKNALVAIMEVKSTNEETKRNVESWFKKYEELNAKFARDFALHQKRVEDLELKMATGGRAGLGHTIGSVDPFAAAMARQSAEYKNFFLYLKSNGATDRDIDFKTLRTDSDVQGGYLVPQVMDNEIRKNITEISPVRVFARVRPSPSKSLDVPRRLALLAASYEGEGEQSPTDQSTYGSEQVTLYRQTVTVPATLDMMVSSPFDLEREIAADVGESFGQNEGANFVSGNSQKRPQGFVTDNRCEVVETATTAEVDFNDIANLIGKLKRGQSPWLFMNRRTLAKMWQIKSSIGVPIWQPVAGSLPATIWGFPYNSDFIDLDDAQNGSGAKPIAFGDLRRGYEIFDMIGISVIRDDLTKKKEAITEWTFRRYNTGRVIMPEAIKILKVK